MKLKGIELKGTYKVKFSDTLIEFYDKNDNVIYTEFSDGYWVKREYDDKSNVIYYEDSDGYWVKREYDEKGNVIYYENSDGYIVDNRVKKLTINDIEKFLGYKIKIKGKRNERF